MITCAIYPRKSKANDNSQSMEQQIEDCRKYITEKYEQANILVYDGDYALTGHSTKNRKDFQRMMADVRNGRIQLVVIMRYDRIARNMRDFCNLYHDMESAGCNLVSVSQQIDTSTPYGKNFMYQMASMAELEWAITSERYKDMHRYKIAHGLAYTGKIPRFGFKIEHTEKGKVLIHDREAETRDIFDYLLKVKSKNATVSYVRQKYDAQFTRRMLEKMIDSDLFVGKARDNEHYCEPYFTEEYMQTIRSVNCIKATPTGNSYLFTGLIKCPLCGRKLSVNIHQKHGNLYVYYRCPNAVQHKHGHFAISESQIETTLKNDLNAYLSAYNAKVVNVSTNEKKSVESQISKLQSKMERLDHLYEIGRMDISDYDSKIDDCKREIAMLEQKISTKATKVSEIMTENWLDLYSELSRRNKTLFWQNIISQIDLDNDKNIIFIHFK